MTRMHRIRTTNLLTIGLNDSQLEEAISAFRRAGTIAHAHALEDGQQLRNILNDQNWDALVFFASGASLSLEQCCDTLRQSESDLPLIVLSEGASHGNIDPQVAAICRRDELTLLVHTTQREILARQTRHQLSATLAELEEAKQRQNLLLSDHQDPLIYIIDGMIIYANQAFCEKLGSDELDGFPIVDLIANRDQERLKSALKKQKSSATSSRLELTLLHSDGSELTCIATCDNTRYEGEDCIQIALSEKDSQQIAGDTDPSTGLANRIHFNELLQEFLNTERNSNSSLLMLGLDRFEELRHGSGLIASEALLKEVADFVIMRLPAQHYGRLSDDILVAILHHVPSDQALEQTNDLLREVENHIFEFDGQSLQCTLSVAIQSVNHLTPPDNAPLLENGFTCLESARLAGGNRTEICVRSRQQLGDDDSPSKLIDNALADQRLQLIFQPMINLSDAEGDHYEASLSIRDWQEGEATAGELMRAIEREPDNHKLDRWLIVEATKQLTVKRQTGEDVHLIINLSGNVFQDLEFCSWLGVAMKAAGLHGNALTLQFSEDSIGRALKPALDCCRELRALGVGVSVREFGRNKTAIKFLRHIMPALLKPGIRQSDPLENDMVREIVQSARTLNSRVVIPNVASAATLAMLWQIGPDFIQGSYVSEPLPEMDYEFASFS